MEKNHVKKSADVSDIQINNCASIISPLSSFGEFNIQPATRELKWISDHTSGTTDADMSIISMLYNQDLALPHQAQKFILQTPQLEERANWERLKAIFYKQIPQEQRIKVFDILSRMSVLEASRVIVKKTLRFENEMIFETLDDDVKFDSQDVSNLQKEILAKLNAWKKKVFDECNHAIKHENTLKLDLEFKSPNPQNFYVWKDNIHEYQSNIESALKARYEAHQLLHAKARFEPRTQWIHVKTKPVLSNQVMPELNFSILSTLTTTLASNMNGTAEERETAAIVQLDNFTSNMWVLGQKVFRNYNSLFNRALWETFGLRYAYDRSPTHCIEILKRHFYCQIEDNDFRIVSHPIISKRKVPYHEVLVYVRKSVTHNLKEEDICDCSTLKLASTIGICTYCFLYRH